EDALDLQMAGDDRSERLAVLQTGPVQALDAGREGWMVHHQQDRSRWRRQRNDRRRRWRMTLARNRKFADSPVEGGGFELPVPGIRSSIFIPPRRHSSLFGELAERVRHRVRRLKPRPTAPACHVESPIDDFLLPLSARRVRVFMHTRTEVRRRARGGGWLGTEETSLNARVLASCDDVDRRRCLHERCGRWGQMGETRRGTLLPL